MAFAEQLSPLADQQTQQVRRRTPEPLVVETPEITSVLSSWVIAFEIDHPPRVPIDASVYGNNGFQHYSPLHYLVEQSHVSPKLVRRVLDAEEAWTWLSVADDLLSAIGCSWMLGEIALFANPFWSHSRVIRELERRGCDVSEVFWEWVDAA